METTRRALLIINPVAGRGVLSGKLLTILNTYAQHGYETTVRVTQRKNEIIEFLPAAAPSFDLVVACGGDGTLNETLNGLLQAEKRPPLGYIPCGTVNDFATSLNIPKDAVRAARLHMERREFICDAGRLGDRCFTYCAAFGAFTNVSYQTPQQTKQNLGRVAYLLEAIRVLPELHAYPLRIELDDGRVIDEDLLFGLFSNSTSVGGMKVLMDGQDVALNDGLLEATFIRDLRTPAELQLAINAILTRETDSPYVMRMKVRRVVGLSKEPVPFTLDGEFGGEFTRFEVEACPGAFTILVGESGGE